MKCFPPNLQSDIKSGLHDVNDCSRHSSTAKFHAINKTQLVIYLPNDVLHYPRPLLRAIDRSLFRHCLYPSLLLLQNNLPSFTYTFPKQMIKSLGSDLSSHLASSTLLVADCCSRDQFKQLSPSTVLLEDLPLEDSFVRN
ncbi:hypothetical protein AVEN_229418-1 [Araneus ventricosus]|uniref:Uncharacterized protein n=1 Tax=Araneus ventricosus TaxID=182803 RepID=A0A4Y2MIY2_ARAVE|nr:hypothetical protein AVEN_229418-1 [Araneus ventricosus]